MPHLPASSSWRLDLSGASHAEREFFIREADRLVQKILEGQVSIPFAELVRLHHEIVAAFGDDFLTERVDILIGISKHALVCGRAMSGIEFAVDGLSAARTLGDPLRLMRALNVLAYCLSDTVDIAGAMEFFSEALQLSIETRNTLAEANLWCGLGSALELAGQHHDAREYLVRAVKISGANQLVRAPALTNLAWSCLHTGDVENGLRYAHDAIAANPDPRTPRHLLVRVLAEAHCARLLLQNNQPAEAIEHVTIAKELSERGKSERGRLTSAASEALCEVARGQSDVGLSRLEGLLEPAREMRSALQDVLLALVSAYRTIGQPGRAQAHLRELSHMARVGQKEYVKSGLPALAKSRATPELPHAHPLNHGDLLNHLPTILRETRSATTLEMLERMALQANWIDDPNGLHMYRVGRLSALLAEEYGVEPDVSRAIEVAGRLHDIGKYSLTIARQGTATNVADIDIERLKMHAEDGAALLSHVQVPGLQFAEDVALHHHERFDGLGYPNHLRGSGIPFAARIVGIVNEFDSLAWPCGSHAPLSIDRAVDEIAAGRATRFDPQLTGLFVALIHRLRTTEPNLREALESNASESRYFQTRTQLAKLLDSPPVIAT